MESKFFFPGGLWNPASCSSRKESLAFSLGSLSQAMCWVFFLLKLRGKPGISGIKETLFMGSIQNRNVAVKVIRLELKRISSLGAYFLLRVTHCLYDSPGPIMTPLVCILPLGSIYLGCFPRKRNLVFIIQVRQNWVSLTYTVYFQAPLERLLDYLP